MPLHHGEIIEKAVRKGGHSITDVARLVQVNRRSVYNWFGQRRLRPDIILRVGSVIQYDFSKDIPNLQEEESFEFETSEEREWKEKYIGLLEKYNELLQKKLVSPRGIPSVV